MANNIVINGTTYSGVEAIETTNSEGKTTMYYADAVRYNAQELTDDQKEQARNNIAAANQEAVAQLIEDVSNIEINSGSSKTDNVYNLSTSGTLSWNGDIEGKVVVPNSIDPDSLSYVRVSSNIPTLQELQKGGTWATTGDDGIEYEETFDINSIVESGNLIIGCDGYFLVAKQDNVSYVEGTDIECTLPKAGIYFVYFGADGYTSKLAINEYKGFYKASLKMESLTPHGHDWYGKAINKGNTVRSDDVIYGEFVKVSNSVPTLAELTKGGTIRHYAVSGNKVSGDLIVASYTESPYAIYSNNGEILIASDGIALVKIKSDGVYFKQDETDCVHSLTINGYTEFTHNVEKIPQELIPEGKGNSGSGGVMIVNVTHEDLTDEMIFSNPTADKTHAEIVEHISNGGFAAVSIVIEVPVYIPLMMLDTEDGDTVIFQLSMGGYNITISFDTNGVVGSIWK